MEYKNPLTELLVSIEQLALQDGPTAATKTDAFVEFERLCCQSGLDNTELARLMGVSENLVDEWAARRAKPSPTALQLIRLVVANPNLSKQLMD
ncbi:transcriptional regulator [Salmonella enterica subsp. enterica serovar Choleraesuis]|nr:transcriptional regulator [Salmonella enterica subsp. enterica serovar Choleraesuis]